MESHAPRDRREFARRIDRLMPLEGSGGWFVVAAVVVFTLYVTANYWLPTWNVRYWPVWLAALALTLGASSAIVAFRRPSRPWLRPTEALAVVAVDSMVLSDLTMVWQPLRDFGIYLKAGQHYLAGNPVYLQSVLTHRPDDLSNYPFLYPPVTLPIFAALSQLPVAVADAVWVGSSFVLAMAALRLIGLPLRWALATVVWPPLFEGLWVGNVAVPALALFAIGPWLGAGLVLGAGFKSYAGIASLWLVKERRWAALAAGVGLMIAFVLLTLPLVGVTLWRDWLDALGLYRTSQQRLPGLYGFGLGRYLPFLAYVALALVALVAAWRATGSESLARFGVATIVASPSVWGHGFLMAVPAILALRAPWFWLALSLSAVPDGIQWWTVIGLIAVSWVAPALRRSTLPDGARHESLHPLGESAEPWPGADEAPGSTIPTGHRPSRRGAGQGSAEAAFGWPLPAAARERDAVE